MVSARTSLHFVVNKIASTRCRRNLHESVEKYILLPPRRALAVDITLPRIIKLPRGLTVRSSRAQGETYLVGSNPPPPSSSLSDAVLHYLSLDSPTLAQQRCIPSDFPFAILHRRCLN